MNNTEHNEILPEVSPEPEVQTQSVISTSDALEIIRKREALFNKLMRVAIEATNESDWIDQNGKPYLQASGAEKVARRFGVRIYDVKGVREDLEDDKGKYYMYTYTGKASLADSSFDTIEAIGTCSSRDRFFGTQQGELKAIEDVDIGNIKKKAYTNFLMNSITRLLGIRNLTWEDLKKYGILREGKTTVSYKKDKTFRHPSKPFWINDFKGERYLFASTFEYEIGFLEMLGMKPTKTDKNVYVSVWTPEREKSLEDEYRNMQNE